MDKYTCNCDEFYTDPCCPNTITTDADGNAYLDINGRKIRYPYADTITERDNADDTERTEHAAGEGDTDAEHAANNRGKV